MDAVELDVELPSGRVRAQRWGEEGAPLALCVHGLSAHMHAFDVLGPALAARGLRVVAPDLRGRGRSPDTGPGTYGVASHARDVAALADALGAEEFDVVGWSMGAIVGLLLAEAAPERLRRLVLVDHAGRMDEEAVEAVRRGLARLEARVGDPAQYVSAIRDLGVVRPWTPFWEAYYRYELERDGDGTWAPSTSRAACTEDLDVRAVERARSAWGAVTMPCLLVRCTEPLAGGLIVPDEELAAIRAAIPHLAVVEVDRNHYAVMEDARMVEAVGELLSTRLRGRPSI